MSFNSIPDELIAQVSSHLADLEDIVNLLQTQKRIKRVLLTYKMDKFRVSSLNVILRRRLQVNNSRKQYIIALDPERGDSLTRALSKFRSVRVLRIDRASFSVLNDDVAESITEANVKIRRVHICLSILEISRIEIDISAENFVKFCCYFPEIMFDCCFDSSWYWDDDLLCQIVASTRMHVVAEDYEVLLNISDRLLESMLSGKQSKFIMLQNATTLFTVKGIRHYVEDHRNQCQFLIYDLGLLNSDQQENAREWFEYIKENKESPYSIRTSRLRNELQRYSIEHKSKHCIVHFAFVMDIDDGNI